MGRQEPVSEETLKKELDELNNGINPRIVQTEVSWAANATVTRGHCQYDDNCSKGNEASFIFIKIHNCAKFREYY